MTQTEIELLYNNLSEDYRNTIQTTKKKLTLLVLLRLTTILLFVFFLVVSIKNDFSPGFTMLCFLSFVLFLIAVKQSVSCNNKHQYFSRLLKIVTNEIHSLHHDFSVFPSGKEFFDTGHHFSYDLDVFGEGSIFQQLNRCSANTGSEKLAMWLKNPLQDKKEILERQDAIKALAADYNFRHRFIALLPDDIDAKTLKKQISAWAKQQLTKKEHAFYTYTGTILSLISALAILLSLFSIVHPSVLFLILLLNGGFIFSKIKKVNQEHARISKQYSAILNFADQIKQIEDSPLNTKLLVDLKSKIKGNDVSGNTALRQLSKLINSFDSRLNLFINIVLNGFFLWDFRCMAALNNWKKQHADQLNDWFNVLDEMDALQSIGNFSFNNPAFTFPEFNTAKFVFSAVQLGHPQIKPENRVCNDVKINKKGSFMIITGPNMAGKSTFLRTIGEAIVLAQCGAPVCAQHIEISPLMLFSSMRTSDSLQNNESYFYSELKRLKMIIEESEKHENTFIILDEILKGTNSVDKASGSKAFLQKMNYKQATGIVATHDLTLGELEENNPEYFTNYCFETFAEDDDLHFDYLLKKGITTKMNATFLMKKMGLI